MKSIKIMLWAIVLNSFLLASDSTNSINTGDTAWVLISTALVLLMTPGLAFFYGGMVRKKNILSVLAQSFFLMVMNSILWIAIGYSLTFSNGNAFIGDMQWLFLNNIRLSTGPYSDTIPHLVFVMFQGMFAIITPALIIGAVVERIRFKFFMVFSLLWTILAYFPIGHIFWSKTGFFASMGALDFAGGNVVHINAGISALVLSLLLGRRVNDIEGPQPHNLPFTIIGTGLLWFGWFGFNAGSALGANGLAANAFITTNTAAASAGFVWAILDKIYNKNVTSLGIATGIVAGLVAITPAAGFVSAFEALIIGAVVSPVCFIAITKIKSYFHYDDTLDVFGVHGIGGIVGALLTGVFANPSINTGIGLVHGNPWQLWIQFLSVIFVLVYSGVVTYILYKVINIFIPARVKESDENIGLDLISHNERAYTLID